VIDLFAPGAYGRAGGGNQEIPQYQSQAVQWISWSINPDNGSGGTPAAWTKARAKWAAAGIQDFPWLHCRSIADIERLISVAESEGSPAIGLNIEDVVGDGLSLREVGGVVLDFWVNAYNKPVHMATLPWVQNGQGWQHVSFAVAALEFFPDEQSIWPGNVYSQKIADDCVFHAFAEGLTKVTTMLKTKNYSPAQYGDSLTVCHSLYTSDDIPPTQAGWAAWKPVSPCKRLVKETNVPLTPKQVPYTGPYYGPSNSKGPNKGPTAKALKRAMVRMGFFDASLGALDNHYNRKLEDAMKKWQRTLPDVAPTGQYGLGSWTAIRSARVGPGRIHAGEYALDPAARELIQREHAADTVVDPPIVKVRTAITDFCLRAEANEEKWTYTQRRPYTGLGVSPESPHGNDCSSYVILAYHWARQQTGTLVPDPSGYNYSGYGNTWDNLDGHPLVASVFEVGDLAHYEGHVTICRKAGSFLTAEWSSFGREAGPEKVTLYYRDDLRFVCRPPLLP
jgi:hypothetical protein